MPNPMKCGGWVLVLLLLSGARTWAADYYVSASGNDADPGSAKAPWRSVDKVNQTALRPGDRVLFQGGQVFVGNMVLDSADSGAAGHPVTITSYGRGRATIDAVNGTALRAQGCDYLALKSLNLVGAGRKMGNKESGLQITGGVAPIVADVDAKGFQKAGVSLASVSKARVTGVHAHDNGSAGINIGEGEDSWSEDLYIGHCVADNNAGDPTNLDNHSGNGIVVGFVRGCLIEYCEAFNNGWNMPREGNGPVGIWVWQADRAIIQFCISHDNKSPSWDGGGFDLDGGVTNSILQYNLSYNNVGPGYFLCQYYPAPTWKDNIIRYNISYNDGDKPGTGAISVTWYEKMSDAEIYNNTCIKDYGPLVGFSDTKVPGIRFRNNLFVSGSELIHGGADKAVFQGNAYWLLGGKPFDVDGHKSLEAWSRATGQETLDGKVVGVWADPKIATPEHLDKVKVTDLEALRDFRLRSGSPCVGAGLPVADNGGRDFWNRPVKADRSPSIGACER